MTNKVQKVILIILSLMTCLLTGCGASSGYKDVVDKYFKAVQKSDPKLMRSITSEAWITDMQKGWYLDDNEILEHLESSIENTRHGHPAEDNIEFKYKIVNTYKADKEALAYVNKDIYDRYARTYFELDKYKITEAYALDISYSILGGSEDDFWGWTRSGFLVIKENGKWKALVLGDYDDSWY